MLASIVERVLQRSSGALITLLLAGFVDPAHLGAYSATVLALVFIQVAVETSFRQSVSIAGPTLRTAAYLRAGSLLTVTIGVPVVAVAAWISASRGIESSATVDLLPLALVPIFDALALRPLVEAQWAGLWREISRSQLIASLVSLVVSLPLLLWRPLMAASAQSLVAAAVFAVGVGFAMSRKRRSRPLAPMEPEQSIPLRETASSNLVAWGQGQGDRVAVGTFASPATFGAYSLALSLTRALADAAAVGINNYLRAQLGQGSSDRTRELLVIALRRTGQYALLAEIVTVIGAWMVLRPLLGPAWEEALRVVPLLSAAVVPGMVSACTTVALIHLGRGRTLISIQSVGLILGLAVGLAAASSLVLAAVALFVREVLLMSVRLHFLRDVATNRSYGEAGIGTLLGACIGVAGYVLWSQM